METREPGNRQKRRWSWRQYSILTLLVFVTIVSVVLGLVTDRAERQRRAVAAIRELGGSVQYDFEVDNGTKTDPPGPEWLYPILGIDYFADVVHVRASGMTDAMCKHLRAFTRLQRLRRDRTHVSDAGLRRLARLTGLQSLWLNDTQINDS